jgi:cyclophilin family peptidyl-prolyl cis-trans isomerase
MHGPVSAISVHDHLRIRENVSSERFPDFRGVSRRWDSLVRWTSCFFACLASAVAAPKLLPVLNHPIPDQTAAGPLSVNLAHAFGMEAIDDQVVRFTSQFSTSGTPVVLDMAIFSNRTPVTRQNFLEYVTGGGYQNSFVHRSVPGFVIQGGGFRINAGNQFESVPTDPPIMNEFGVSNTLGTISMAKVGGNPDSATSQWFVSLGENSDTLDPQNGGFTVFGRITKSTLGNAQAFGNPNIFPIYDYGDAFTELPLWSTHVPPNIFISELILFHQVELVPLPPGEAGEDPTLAYAVVSDSNPGIAALGIEPGGSLTVSPVPGQSGSTFVTVRATDSAGNTVDDTFTVNVNRTDAFSTWAAEISFPNGESGIAQNPDGDAWNNLQEFAFLGDPALPDQTGRTIFPGQVGTTAKYLTITFPVRKFTQGLTYSVEANSTLSGSWTEIWKSTDGFSHARVVSAMDLTDRTVVTIQDAAEAGPRRFLRIRIVQE